MDWLDIRTVTTILFMVLLPGWALLAITDYWKKWNPLQRWLLAITIGISFWPVLYYSARTLFPMLRLGTNKILLILILGFIIIVWKLRDNWKEHFAFEALDYAVLLVLGLTFFTRFVMIEKYPYPSWTDSLLHHTLITEITATTGKLPFTLAPYETTSLSEYHLGLYGLTAPLQLLTNLSADSALLWMSQFLNGICGIGVFLLLDKKVTRTAGLFGLITSGLLSFQPTLYFSWGRFTQLGGQVLLLQAVLIFWQVLEDTKDRKGIKGWSNWAELFLAALVCAAMALIHFRAAAFALSLFLIIFVWEAVRPQEGNLPRKNMVFSTLIISAMSIVLILPALIPALSSYLAPVESVDLALTREVAGSYYGGVTWKTFFSLGVAKWLTILSGLGFVAGLLFRKTRPLSLMIAIWCFTLLGEGYLYQTGIGKLAFTNMTGIMIMAYLPAGIFVGLFGDAILSLSARYNLNLQYALVSIALLAGVVASFDRVEQFDDYRYFMTGADEKAMQWISNNTSPDSLIGINTYFWLSDAAHGSDAGYWLPYYAGRSTTTGVMISNFNDEYDEILKKWIM